MVTMADHLMDPQMDAAEAVVVPEALENSKLLYWTK